MPNAECRPYAPGWMNALPDTMAYLVDHLRDLPDVDSVRLSLDRRVNINKFGAWYPYYTSQQYWRAQGRLNWNTTNVPSAGYDNYLYQNAVVFWPEYTGHNPILMPPDNVVGYTYGKFAFEKQTFIPNTTMGAIVLMDKMEMNKDSIEYYSQNPLDWNADKIHWIKNTIAHELGHSIGMPHDIGTLLFIMGERAISYEDSLGKLLFYSPYTRNYSEQSNDKTTILKEIK